MTVQTLRMMSTLMTLSVGFVLLTGMDSCGSPPPEKAQQCQVADDCKGLPHVDCVGSWSCEAGQCYWECGQGCTTDAQCSQGQLCIDGTCQTPEPPGGCTSDADCAESEMCVFPVFMPCPAGEPCGQPLPDGTCVPKPDETCYSDEDCAAGEQCVYDDAPCPPDMACPAVLVGTCQPKSEGCQADSDCDPGEMCAIAPCMSCPPNAICEPCSTDGICVEKPSSECSADSDCGPNQWCDFIDCDGFACSGVCRDETPPPPEGCYSDAECKPGQYCLKACANCACPAGVPCDCPPCEGTCIDSPQVEPCVSDADCGPGESCQCGSDPSCPACDVCLFQCMPAPQPTCTDDSDCKGGQYCEIQVCPGCWCPEDGECECPPCSGQCKDEPQPQPWCTSDSECPDGQTCTCVSDPTCPECDGCSFQCVDHGPPPEPDACQPTGCSGEICASEPIDSDCSYDPWYACLQLTKCGNYGANGGCGWQMTEEYKACLMEFGVEP